MKKIYDLALEECLNEAESVGPLKSLVGIVRFQADFLRKSSTNVLKFKIIFSKNEQT